MCLSDGCALMESRRARNRGAILGSEQLNNLGSDGVCRSAHRFDIGQRHQISLVMLPSISSSVPSRQHITRRVSRL